jgi:hypothetical protein
LLRLLARGLEVVGANPSRRTEPVLPTASNISEDGSTVHVWTTKEAAEADSVERVRRMGLGLVLIHLDAVIPKLKAAADANDESIWPLFDFRWNDHGTVIGEDHFFFGLLERAGVAVHVDHRLSWEVGHVGERVLFPADAQVARIVAKARTRPTQ